jgi:predicted hydrolase (HD superfamily)
LGGLSLHSAAILANALGAIAAARVGASMATMQGHDVLALLHDHSQQASLAEHSEAIQPVIDLISTRFTAQEEDKKPWWQ